MGKIMRVGAWLTDLRAEETAAGIDHYELVCSAPDLTLYVRTHLDGAALALGDARARIPEPYLPESDQRKSWEESRSAFIASMAELIKAAGHALNAVGCTQAELDTPSVPQTAPDDDAVETKCSNRKAHVDEIDTGLTDHAEAASLREETCEQPYNHEVTSCVTDTPEPSTENTGK